jgi:RHS repeat-associated protein
LSGSIGGAGGIGGLLGRTDANGSTFYHADGLGNVTALINSSNILVAQYLYSPFGQVIAKWGAYQDLNEMQFSSVPHQNQSEFSMFPYRVYDPVLMRWVSSDPIGELGGLNLYGFVFNSPPNLTDPMGLFAPMTLPSAFKTVTTMTEMAGTVGAGTTLVGGAALAGTASIMSPFVIGFLGMNLQNDPYLNPNGVNAPPSALSVMLPPMPPVPPKGSSAACPNSPNGDNEFNATGREAHKWYKYPEGFRTEVTLNDGSRVDAINYETREILELKPNNPDAIASGNKQLNGYIQQAQKQFGGQWSGRVVTY